MLVMVACVSNLSTQHTKLRQEDYKYLGQSGLYKEALKQINRPAWTTERDSISNNIKKRKEKKTQNRMDLLGWNPGRERLF